MLRKLGRDVACALALVALLVPAIAHASRTGSAGGPGGRSFSKPCPSDRVLVGFQAFYGGTVLPPGTYVNALRGICQRVDRRGRWVGERSFTGWVGGKEGRKVTRQCRSGQAVSAFSGRAGAYLDRLTIRCKPMAANGLLAPSGFRDLPAVGGSSGDPIGLKACTSNRPARAFVGGAGAVIDRLALDCSQLNPPRPGSFTYVRPPASRVLSKGDAFEFAASGDSVFQYQVCFAGRTGRTESDCAFKSPRLPRRDTRWWLDGDVYLRVQGRRVDWHVRAYNAWGRFSQSSTFSSRVAPPWAEPTEPASGATVATRRPTLRWKPAWKRSQYVLNLRRGSFQRQYDVQGYYYQENSFTLPDEIPAEVGNPVQWWVASCTTIDGERVCTPRTPPREFVHAINVAGVAVPGIPGLTSPANGAQVMGKVREQPQRCRDIDPIPTLDWNGTSAASRYEWEFRNVTQQKSPRRGFTVLTRTSVGTGIFAGDTYRWRVRGINSAGQAGAWSPERTLVGVPGPIIGDTCVQTGESNFY